MAIIVYFFIRGAKNIELYQLNIKISYTVAKQNLEQAESQKKEEDNLIIRCINELGLIQLDRDDSISSEAMIKSCQRLLSNASDIRYELRSCILNIIELLAYYFLLANWNNSKLSKQYPLI